MGCLSHWCPGKLNRKIFWGSPDRETTWKWEHPQSSFFLWGVNVHSLALLISLEQTEKRHHATCKQQNTFLSGFLMAVWGECCWTWRGCCVEGWTNWEDRESCAQNRQGERMQEHHLEAPIWKGLPSCQLHEWVRSETISWMYSNVITYMHRGLHMLQCFALTV